MSTHRNVLITGAGHGIGAATARAFAAVGDHALVTDVDIDAASAVAAEIAAAGGSASAHLLDVASTAGWNDLAGQLAAAGREPAVVVNNAFRLAIGAAHEIDDDTWNRQIDVNLSGVYRSMRTFHRSLTAAQGSMINVSSVHALVSWAGYPAYEASKGGMITLTRQLSVEYAPHVRVNAVLPGSVETRVWDGADDAVVQDAKRQATLGRLARPEEIASVIVFLASEGASYITGAAIPVDGGQSTTVAT